MLHRDHEPFDIIDPQPFVDEHVNTDKFEVNNSDRERSI